MRFFTFGVIRIMNILIVGNGFDLSHYLPTKYDHFMVAMQAIENWDELKGDMGFDDLFGSLYEKENYFFSYTKAMYKTDEIKIPVDRIQALKEQLRENVWYQYFLDHVREVKTWIDFETKIENALFLVTETLEIIESKYSSTGTFNDRIFYSKDNVKSGYKFIEYKFDALSKLGLFFENINYGRHANNSYGKDIIAGYLPNDLFVVDGNEKYGFNTNKYIQKLQNSLEDLMGLFNLYLELVINKLLPICELNINSEDWIKLDKIYSFNYTNTYQRIYDNVDIDFLHGSSGETQNIVLGISELHAESLKKLKAYGFTKYHQKLLKQTDYSFLDDSTEVFKSIKRGRTMIDKELKFFNFYIWGHSLDSSDQEYIHELFSFNLGKDQYVRVIIFYFSKQANFELLANLLHVLGKEKVETWMKKGWLKFEPNPDIAKLNNIEPVELPKLAEA